MIKSKTEEQLAIMKENSSFISQILSEVAAILKPGITTLEIDTFCKNRILENGGIPTFYKFHGYPFHICASVNEVVVHGFPNKVPIKDGDIVSIDVGITKNGFVGEHAYTFIVGEVAPEIQQLVKVTKESLYKGIEKAVYGNRVGDIGYAIQEHTEKKHGYGVVRALVGHGLGKTMHEDPQVPNYGKRGT
ncbi:MAG: type I methionyl aminopeptidase, partial [Bacteroidetes bacterium]